jgi:hypothetical protein
VGFYGAFLGDRDDLARVVAWILPRYHKPWLVVDAPAGRVAVEGRDDVVLVLVEPSVPRNDEEDRELLTRLERASAEAAQRWPDRSIRLAVAVAGMVSQRTQNALDVRGIWTLDRNWIVRYVCEWGMESMVRPLFDEVDDGQQDIYGPAYEAIMRQRSSVSQIEPTPAADLTPVHYGQLYLLDGDADLPPFDGARTPPGLVRVEPGAAVMMTGLHTGTVQFTVSVHDQMPAPQLDAYDDVVEASFESRDGTASLVGWAGEYSRDLPPLPGGPGTYRLRYHTRGMDAAAAAGSSDAPIDEYLLQIWPAPHAPAATLKHTSQQYTYWHNQR